MISNLSYLTYNRYSYSSISLNNMSLVLDVLYTVVVLGKLALFLVYVLVINNYIPRPEIVVSLSEAEYGKSSRNG